MHKLTWKIKGVTNTLVVEDLHEVNWMGYDEGYKHIIRINFDHEIDHLEITFNKKPEGWDALYTANSDFTRKSWNDVFNRDESNG